jgi:autotransporter-associated beta strand protein
MLGTVTIPSGSTLRWSANTTANGGDSATFDVEGGMTSKAGAVSLGALTGAGSIDGGSTTSTTYTIGLKNSDTTFTGTLHDGGAALVLIKAGTGKLTLNGTITYSGNSTVNSGTLALVDPVSLDNSANLTLGGGTIDVSGRADDTVALGNSKVQTLAGNGNITGNLNELANSFVRPGLGVIAASGSATLAGGIVMQLNDTNVTKNSEITAASFSISGPLTVTNVGPTLQGGDTFQLFNHAVTGFSATNLPVLGAGMIWTNKLAINGSIAVIATVNTSPTNITSLITGGGTTLTLSWPADHTGWRLLAQTNTIGKGLGTNWSPVPGSASVNSVIVPLNPGNGTVFYRMVYP